MPPASAPTVPSTTAASTASPRIFSANRAVATAATARSATATNRDADAGATGSAAAAVATRSTEAFVEITEPSRLAYRSLIDFVPDHESYEHLTVVDLDTTGDGTRIRMQIEPLHDEVWTQRLLDGRANELANLARVV